MILMMDSLISNFDHYKIKFYEFLTDPEAYSS